MFDTASPELPLRLQAFLQSHWGRPVRVSGLRRFPAGMSWITLAFTAQLGTAPGLADRLEPASDAAFEQRELILRIGDPGGLQAPYSAEPEFHSLTALAGVQGLPIPQALAFSDDERVLGAPFLVTQRMDGDTPMPWKGAADERGEAMNHSLGCDFADALAAIHAFDWRTSDTAKRLPPNAPVNVANTAVLELNRWAKHADVPGKRAPPQMHYAKRWLETNAPVADRITIVHGDYRVGNFLQRDGRITAILDWELVHLGDPHEDIAWAGSRTFSGGTTRIGGLIEREEFYDRYQRHTGLVIRPERVRYYEALVQFKMAALLIGALQRIESGRADDIRMAAMGFQLAPTLLELNRLIELAS
jgi:aminoglycoside phosphotransferase (APT) family kinase protein